MPSAFFVYVCGVEAEPKAQSPTLSFKLLALVERNVSVGESELEKGLVLVYEDSVCWT